MFKKNYEKEYDKHEEEFQRFITSFFFIMFVIPLKSLRTHTNTGVRERTQAQTHKVLKYSD